MSAIRGIYNLSVSSSRRRVGAVADLYHALSRTTRPSFSTEASVDAAAAKHHAGDLPTIKPFTDIPRNWKGSLPILGGMPMFLPYVDKKTGGMRTEDFMNDMYEHYGGKTHGLCRFGPTGEECVIVFNETYLQVLQHEGKYPTGILEGSWPIQQYNDKYVDGMKNPFLASGEEWRRGRMAINPYLFNIQTAQTYLGAINATAASAARKFDEYALTGNLDRFCELASFDMFVAASLGLQLNSAGGDPNGLDFANKIIGCISRMGQVSAQCPYSQRDAFKFKTWDTFVSEWTAGRKASKELVKMALEEGLGTGKGIMHGFLGDPDMSIADEEATEMNLILTFAAADTTSSLINSVLTNLSRNVDVQDKIRAELKQVLNGEDYNPKAKLRYFDQVLKESQRLTPPLPWVNVKSKIPNDIVLGEYAIPSGTTIVFSHMAIKNDESYAGPDPHKFNPDRYSEQAIAARKGTKAEFLDHPICAKPFGFGARMCVGSRVAKLEYMSLLCRILQDYRLEYDVSSSAPTVRLSRATTTEQPCPIFKVARI